MTYRLAPMSPGILVLTMVHPRDLRLDLAPRPPDRVRGAPARHRDHWPLRRQEIPRGDIEAVRIIDRQTLRRETGWGMRVGAGGLFGAFGYLWTTRRGLVRMFVSRTDRFVWIERTLERPWLITPEQPDAFVRALSIHG